MKGEGEMVKGMSNTTFGGTQNPQKGPERYVENKRSIDTDF